MHQTINTAGTKFLAARGISSEIAIQYGIYTENSSLIFPYFSNDVAVNEKHRSLTEKRFWQREGGVKTFWNEAALYEAAADPSLSLIITEGEIDALSLIQCGIHCVVSVPEGAPPPTVKSRMEKKVEDENVGKFSFMADKLLTLKNIKRFVLAVDNDEPGRELANQLVRRLGPGRCSFVVYPDGCKDINDVLIKHGENGVLTVISQAKPYPVKGLKELNEYPDLGPMRTYSTGWEHLDQHFRLFPGELVVVSGIPNHGKTPWVMNLVVRLAKHHNWVSTVLSPEMPVKPQLYETTKKACVGLVKPEEVNAFINTYIKFIDVNDDSVDVDPTLEWAMECAIASVERFNSRVFVIDPWNEIEHNQDGQSTTEYIGRALRKLKRFAKRYDVVVIIVAHPTKEVKGKDGVLRKPTLYDIDGSAHWYNKPDHGIVIYRHADQSGADIKTEVCVAKSRFMDAGTRGLVYLQHKQGRYIELNAA